MQRLLACVLYGGDDPMTANGRFVAPMRDHLMRIGGERVDAYRIEGGRSGLFIEERKFGISSIIARWTGGEELVETVDPTTDLSARPVDSKTDSRLLTIGLSHKSWQA